MPEEIQNNEEGGEKKKRISFIESLLMIGVCFFFFDLSQIILEWLLVGFLVNWLITITAGATVGFWLWMRDIPLIKPSKLIAWTASFLIDIIPGTDFSIILAFTWTISTAIILGITYFEDKSGIKIPTKSIVKNKA